MEDKRDNAPRPMRGEEADLSELTIEQLTELRNAIVAKARKRVGPEGFEPLMMATEDTNWWDYLSDPADRIARAINIASQRISLAVLTFGLGLTSAGLYNSQRGANYAGIALAGAGISAAWFVIAMFRAGVRSSAR